MPFVKLDCGILDSTIWFDHEARELFLTALLMAEPQELTTPMPQLEISSLRETGWSVPPGWYGFVPASALGIIGRARTRMDDDAAMKALERLGAPEAGSRSPAFEGRRLVRVDGGFIALNFQKHRDRDYGGAERARRYRERNRVTRDGVTSPRDGRDSTQAEAEAEVEGEGKRPSLPVEAEASGNGEAVGASRPTRARFIPPTINDVRTHVAEKGWTFDPEAFVAFYESKGWKVGGSPMKSWQAACVTWSKRDGRDGKAATAATPQQGLKAQANLARVTSALVGKSTTPSTPPRLLRDPFAPDAPPKARAAAEKRRIADEWIESGGAMAPPPSFLPAAAYGPDSRDDERVRLMKWEEGDNDTFDRKRSEGEA